MSIHEPDAAMGATVRLHCETRGMPLTVQVVDAGLRPVRAAQIGNATFALPLGVYLVQFSLGNERVERPVGLLSQQADVHVGPERNWLSATPFALDKTDSALIRAARHFSSTMAAGARPDDAQLLVILSHSLEAGDAWLGNLTLERGERAVATPQPSAIGERIAGLGWPASMMRASIR